MKVVLPGHRLLDARWRVANVRTAKVRTAVIGHSVVPPAMEVNCKGCAGCCMDWRSLLEDETGSTAAQDDEDATENDPRQRHRRQRDPLGGEDAESSSREPSTTTQPSFHDPRRGSEIPRGGDGRRPNAAVLARSRRNRGCRDRRGESVAPPSRADRSSSWASEVAEAGGTVRPRGAGVAADLCLPRSDDAAVSDPRERSCIPTSAARTPNTISHSHGRPNANASSPRSAATGCSRPVTTIPTACSWARRRSGEALLSSAAGRPEGVVDRAAASGSRGEIAPRRSRSPRPRVRGRSRSRITTAIGRLLGAKTPNRRPKTTCRGPGQRFASGTSAAGEAGGRCRHRPSPTTSKPIAARPKRRAGTPSSEYYCHGSSGSSKGRRNGRLDYAIPT